MAKISIDESLKELEREALLAVGADHFLIGKGCILIDGDECYADRKWHSVHTCKDLRYDIVGEGNRTGFYRRRKSVVQPSPFPAFIRVSKELQSESETYVNVGSDFFALVDGDLLEAGDEVWNEEVNGWRPVYLPSGYGEIVGSASHCGLHRRKRAFLPEVKLETILEEAERLVSGTRQADYGSPLSNHRRTAEMWSSFLGIKITPVQVCLLNILQKLSRAGGGRLTRDTIVDIAGFARNVELVQMAEAAEKETP